MLSGFEYPSLLRAAADRGAAGYLMKTADLAELAPAVRRVAAGGTAFSSTSMRAIRGAILSSKCRSRGISATSPSPWNSSPCTTFSRPPCSVSGTAAISALRMANRAPHPAKIENR